jgi:signal peptidase II
MISASQKRGTPKQVTKIGLMPDFCIFVVMERGIKRTLIVLAIILANLALDQWTKELARQHLSGNYMYTYWNDFFRLLYVENKGAFLSLGSSLTDQLRYWVLHYFPSALLAVMLGYVLLDRRMDRWQIYSFSFIIGGGFSNIIDRILYGQVTDFMNIGIGSLRTGIFNFADVSIMLGLGLMLPAVFRKQSTI